MLLVAFALCDTRASFSPLRAFSRLDFPAFGRPMSATNPAFVIDFAL